jgi:hypothetical protein
MIDIGHPAHVHYFRTFYREMSKAGHEFLITARDKEMSHALLNGYGIPFVSRGAGANSALGKLLYLPRANMILLREARRFRPDVFLSFSSPYAAQVSALVRRPHVAFDDTEHAKLGRFLYAPFTDVVLSPSSYRGKPIRNQVLFNGSLELLYLHPRDFTPDPSVLSSAGVQQGEPYSFLRFVSWNAHHDIGASGMTLENKRRAVRELEKFGKVLISSEAELPADLSGYRIEVDPTLVHHLLHFASVSIGESATMASESAVVGTPAIYMDRTGRGYTDELERTYGLVYNFSDSLNDQVSAIEKACALLSDSEAAERHARGRDAFLAASVDVNATLVDTVRSTVAAHVS